jgi:hypothetical protein
MKYIINERQYRLLVEEEQEVLQIPSLELFNNDWETLQKFLERRGNPLYSIGRDLVLFKTPIQSLGNLTSVGRNLYLNGCKNLTSLGNLTSVGGSLYLNGCKNLTSLGNLTSVGEGLNLAGTNIKSLGNLTSVGDYLDLRETPVSRKYSENEIRQMVKVGGEVYL